MRPEIRKQWIGDSTQALCPGYQTVLTVYTDTQNLGIYPLEPIQGDLVGGDLRSSDWRPGQWEESDENILFSQVIT
jgi:hypothetical protein